MENQNLPNFSCTHSPNLPQLLAHLNCTLVITTYQAGKVIFISSDGQKISQLPRQFTKPMGVAIRGDKMGVAALESVQVFKNNRDLAPTYPKNPGVYDSMFMPRASYYTGMVDIHDLEFGPDGHLYGVNTLFSCLVRIDEENSFTPVWQPPFITELQPEDRCHLNGMAVDEQGKIRYATAFCQGNSKESWRGKVTTSGILMDVAQNKVILEGLPMPHSPRLFDGELYLVLSATGELIKVNTEEGSYEVVCNLNGFVRGLDKCGDFLFVGMSKMRKTSSTFKQLQAEGKLDISGVLVVHLPTRQVVANLLYQTSVEEIYDIKLLPGCRRPNILTAEKIEARMGLVMPTLTFWGKTDEKKKFVPDNSNNVR